MSSVRLTSSKSWHGPTGVMTTVSPEFPVCACRFWFCLSGPYFRPRPASPRSGGFPVCGLLPGMAAGNIHMIPAGSSSPAVKCQVKQKPAASTSPGSCVTQFGRNDCAIIPAGMDPCSLMFYSGASLHLRNSDWFHLVLSPLLFGWNETTKQARIHSKVNEQNQ